MQQIRILAAAFLLLLISSAAHAVVCPSNVTGITPSQTSCWPMQETVGTTITDTNSVNNGTISGAYTLNQAPGGIACANSTGSGCSIVTSVNYTNPQPMTFYWDFVGTGGGLGQLGTSSSLSAVPYYAFYLDTYGRLTFGINNFQTQTVIQTPLPYADGNEHKAVVSIGSGGANIYVDGQKVASGGVMLASYANGYWYFGGFNGTGWANAPALTQFNGTLITAAWWNGTQLSDQQAIQITGGIPSAITNNYCTFSNQIAGLNPSQGMAFANRKLTFTTLNTLQVPGIGSTLPIGPSQIICQTDATGNILSGCQIPQGAHVNLSVGSGPPISMVIPASTSCDLTAIIMSQTDPPEVVSAVAVAGPLFAGTTVTNPPAGTIGTATITAPAAFSQTQASAATVNVGLNGNNQQVVMTGNVAVSLTNFVSGASFSIDTTENGTGGYSPTFSVPGGWTLVWSGGMVQPAMPSTLANVHVEWYFQAISATQIVGSLQAAGTGSFPLQATANANNYSIINLDQAVAQTQTAPTSAITATCTGTCATTYTYEITCVADNNIETIPSASHTATNAASLSSSNNNQVSWTNDSKCHGGYNVYGRIGGSLGLLHNVASTPYTDTGADTPGAAPPVINATGMFKSSGIAGFKSTWIGGNGVNDLATAHFLPVQGFDANITNASLTDALMPSATYVTALYCRVGVDPGSGKTWTFALYKNDGAVAMACTITGSGGGTNVSCNDTAAGDAATLQVGDTASTAVTSTGSPGTTWAVCSYLVLQ